MGPNWLAYLVRALSAVPYIVTGIEQIHGSAISGSSKKELALQALGLGAAVAPALDPQHADTITAAAQLASSTIDGVVSVMNAAKGTAAKPPLSVVSGAGAGTSAPAPAAPAHGPVVHVPVPAGDHNLEVEALHVAPIQELLR